MLFRAESTGDCACPAACTAPHGKQQVSGIPLHRPGNSDHLIRDEEGKHTHRYEIKEWD